MLTVRGVEGEIRHGYAVAAQLRDFTATGDRNTLTLTGSIVRVDDYRIAQRPLSFVIPVKGWTWQVESLQIEGGTLIAALVLQE